MGPIEETIQDFVNAVLDNDTLTVSEQKDLIISVMLNMIPYIDCDGYHRPVVNSMIGRHITLAKQRKKIGRS